MTKRGFPPGSVCKPCWELKYCPYGSLVEFFPSAGDSSSPEEVAQRRQDTLTRLMGSQYESEQELDDDIHALYANNPDDWAYVQQFQADEVNCRVFGHACPVFFSQSPGTETRDFRRDTRYIPRTVMFKVVRRDQHICQICRTHVHDDEIEFDHIIPFSRGGPTTAENLRLLCRKCNQSKSGDWKHLLSEP